MSRNGMLFGLVLLAAALVAPARGTWSILIVDKETKEVAIGSATCLLNFNLQANLPVVIVERGAAAAQSLVDASARNRRRIHALMLQGLAPAEILDQLDPPWDPQFESRQYGIVDTLGRAATFTGANAGAFAGGRTGEVGNLVYAIQGNVLTGVEVLDAAEDAVRNLDTDVPGKLMAAMEAARLFGGDGRCSCDNAAPTNCGAPPPEFEKSAHIGFMIVARRGDVDGICFSNGCAQGQYWLNFNILAPVAGVPDPVITMRAQFDQFRAARVGVPDQVRSIVQFPRLLPPSSAYTRTLRVELRDWQGLPITTTPTVEALSDPRDGSGLISGGPATSLGGGVYEVTIQSSDTPGEDRIAVRVLDAGFDRILTPATPVRVLARGDLNGDGRISLSDVAPFVLALTDPTAFQAQFPEVVADIVGDFTADGSVSVDDIQPFVDLLVGR